MTTTTAAHWHQLADLHEAKAATGAWNAHHYAKLAAGERRRAEAAEAAEATR